MGMGPGREGAGKGGPQVSARPPPPRQCSLLGSGQLGPRGPGLAPRRPWPLCAQGSGLLPPSALDGTLSSGRVSRSERPPLSSPGGGSRAAGLHPWRGPEHLPVPTAPPAVPTAPQRGTHGSTSSALSCAFLPSPGPGTGRGAGASIPRSRLLTRSPAPASSGASRGPYSFHSYSWGSPTGRGLRTPREVWPHGSGSGRRPGQGSAWWPRGRAGLIAGGWGPGEGGRGLSPPPAPAPPLPQAADPPWGGVPSLPLPLGPAEQCPFPARNAAPELAACCWHLRGGGRAPAGCSPPPPRWATCPRQLSPEKSGRRGGKGRRRGALTLGLQGSGAC